MVFKNKILIPGMTETVKFNADADRQMTYTVWSLTPRSQSFTEFLKINLTGNNYSVSIYDARKLSQSSAFSNSFHVVYLLVCLEILIKFGIRT